MSQTLKEYLTAPYSAIYRDSVLDSVMPISEFRKALAAPMKGQASWTSTRYTKPISEKPQGYITLESVFDPKNCYDEDGHPEYFVDDLDAFIKKYGNWEVTEENGDNTYNYNSPVEDPININQVTIVNPNSKAFESKDLDFMSVNLSLDVRGNYSDSVIAVFDNDSGEHYSATAFFLIRFDIVGGDFIYHNKKYTYGFQASLSDEDLFLTISPNEGDLPAELDDEFTVFCDTSSKEDIQNVLEKTLADAFDDNQAKIDQLTVEYYSEMMD